MLASLTSQAIQILETFYGVADAPVSWDPPKEASHGDLATSVCLRLAKQLGKNPVEMAKVLAEKLNDSPSVAKAEVAGPGYVNVWLTPSVLIDELKSTLAHTVPHVINKKDAPVIVDYSAPNIAKPLGIHHILSTVIGQTVVNLHAHAGTPVVRWNYLGDWGTQFGKLALAFERWGSGKKASEYSLDELLKLYVAFHDEAEKDAALEDEARATFKKLEDGDKELRAFWSDVVHITKSSLSDIYARLNVSFDVELGESAYENKMAPIVTEGTKKNVFTEGEKGALIAQFPEDTGMPPAVIVKADGATLYHTRDLALMKDRIETYKPQAIYYVVDMAQSLHFKQLFAIAGQLGWDLPTLEHLAFGRMRFADGSMSTRKGNILKLEEVLDEAVKRAAEIIAERGDAIQTDDPKDLAEMMGVGALVYGILSQNRKMDMVFDWDKMLSFEGNSAPYLQYTHARAKSVLRKAGVEEGEIGVGDIAEFTPHERALINLLLQYGAVLDSSRRDHLPHKLANYLYQLCQEFNAFYNTDTIVTADEPQRSLRLHLTSVTAAVLRSGASILTIRVPDRM